MNRGTFLKNLSLSAGAIVFSPLLSFAQKDRVKIYKVDRPVYQITFTNGQRDIFGNLIELTEVAAVSTRYGTFEERLKLYKDKENISVILYEEGSQMLKTLTGPPDISGQCTYKLKEWKYSRARIYEDIEVIKVN